MIRNIVVGRLKDGVPKDRVEAALASILALDAPGRVSCDVGTDLGLREGSFDFAITNVFVDEAAYRAYDLDEEHNRIRREMFAPMSESLVRIQIEVD